MGQNTGVFTHERRESSSYEPSYGEFWVLTVSIDFDFDSHYSYLSAFDVAIIWLLFIENLEDSHAAPCRRDACFWRPGSHRCPG